MLLNAFDVDPGGAERSVELRSGELFALGLQADLLVISAYAGHYAPVPGTLVARLSEMCGLELERLPRQLDLSHGPLAAWLSPPLQELPDPPRWPSGSATRFGRVAVIETPSARRQARFTPCAETAWPAFQQLFSLLALLPLQGIDCPVVAVPLLSAGNQGIRPERLFPALLERCRDGFRHVPDLERLVVFDRQHQPLEDLAGLIDAELGRCPSERELLQLPQSALMSRELPAILESFQRRHPNAALASDLAELRHLFDGLEMTAVAIGLHSRRLVERMVRERLGWRRGTLFQGIQVLSRQGTDPWIISCLHQVRVFGNWMGHPSPPGQRRSVSLTDVQAMLAALQRLLEDYPW